MKPTETTAREFKWRFKDIGILIMFDRRSKQWLGSIRNAEGVGGPLPMLVLDTIIATHSLEKHVQ